MSQPACPTPSVWARGVLTVRDLGRGKRRNARPPRSHGPTPATTAARRGTLSAHVLLGALDGGQNDRVESAERVDRALPRWVVGIVPIRLAAKEDTPLLADLDQRGFDPVVGAEVRESGLGREVVMWSRRSRNSWMSCLLFGPLTASYSSGSESPNGAERCSQRARAWSTRSQKLQGRRSPRVDPALSHPQRRGIDLGRRMRLRVAGRPDPASEARCGDFPMPP